MPVYCVKLVKTSSPKFMHNATSAGKLPTWSYTYYDEEEPTKKGSFDINMTRNMAGDENKQSKQMNDAAIALVKSKHTGVSVRLVK
ncbi:hypothetical protein PHYC_01544 [Phycisphaerales bacterium]|nr:hypothetical protein PHYC_01544 [Phycisphaerales bacterium]